MSFHVKINEPFNGLEEGTYNGELSNPTSGQWTYNDDNIKLNINDKVYYWIFIEYNGRAFTYVGPEYIVTGWYSKLNLSIFRYIVHSSHILQSEDSTYSNSKSGGFYSD